MVVACRSPLPLTIRVSPVQTAHLELRRLSEASALTLSPCEAPCTVQVQPDAKYEVSVSAPTYYTATLRFDYEMVFNSRNDEGGGTVLIVPLFRLPDDSSGKKQRAAE